MTDPLATAAALASQGWVRTAFWTVVLLGITALLARLLTRGLRKLLSHDSTPLPSSSIIVNIARATVWVIGGSIVLSSCFGINVNTLVAALGVGGIAVSLGFQDTLSNLIGGLQMTFMRIVAPGDNIEVGTESGVVQDVSWRHTTIVNGRGETVIIPNSVISKTALVHLPPVTQISVPFAVTASGTDLDRLREQLAQATREAVLRVCPLEQEPTVLFSEVTEFGFRGKVALRIADPAHVGEATDAVVRAIAPLTR